MTKHACLVYYLLKETCAIVSLLLKETLITLCCFLSLQEIRTTLVQERKNQKSEANAFVLCILSHGAKGVIVGTDGEHISIDTITAIFDGESCPQLSNKPKIFVFQACQGGEYLFAPSSTSSERVRTVVLPNAYINN